ncbi:hypothetical protein [Chelatococcus reniformis]|uniref:Uncharacterized protein n=1 Tax=Chelatococcus reniformis TaxID=1494448 RepID=A0A916U670_9HYPH|nr:hypothetical protein [Chelatococcus reniformis]GGC61369.1 hypothetical protein GCM10010994_19910 [Chelatococcus reniformis]
MKRASGRAAQVTVVPLLAVAAGLYMPTASAMVAVSLVANGFEAGPARSPCSDVAQRLAIIVCTDRHTADLSEGLQSVLHRVRFVGDFGLAIP